MYPTQAQFNLAFPGSKILVPDSKGAEQRRDDVFRILVSDRYSSLYQQLQQNQSLCAQTQLQRDIVHPDVFHAKLENCSADRIQEIFNCCIEPMKNWVNADRPT